MLKYLTLYDVINVANISKDYKNPMALVVKAEHLPCNLIRLLFNVPLSSNMNLRRLFVNFI